MDIGRASRESAVSVKMIRYYEAIGLLPKPTRTSAGYRLYDPEDVQTLRFIAYARHVGLSIEEVRELLRLWQDRARPCALVRKLARRHIALLKGRSEALCGMVETLEALGGVKPDGGRPRATARAGNRQVEPARARKGRWSPRREARRAEG